MPRSLAQLLTRVAQVIRAHTEAVDHAFVANLIGSLKSLRAHAISLTQNMHQAEDLVQKTVLKAINKQEEFEAGTNLQAWRFTTLRNLFFSGRRTKQREVEDTDGTHAATMITIPDQEDRLTVQDLHTALAKLPREQREALLLIVGEGQGKGRIPWDQGRDDQEPVNRARTRLAELMGLVRDDSIAWSHGAPA
jgi:RNA polymerase sigma-70 factor, ECF subfamily